MWITNLVYKKNHKIFITPHHQQEICCQRITQISARSAADQGVFRRRRAIAFGGCGAPRVGFAFQIRSVNRNPINAIGIMAYGQIRQLSAFPASGFGTRQPCASRIFDAGSVAP